MVLPKVFVKDAAQNSSKIEKMPWMWIWEVTSVVGKASWSRGEGIHETTVGC